MGKVIVALLLVAIAKAQYFPPSTGGGGGSGTVTSIGLSGTANQITVTGTSPVTGAGSWTLSFPVGGVTLPGTTTGTFTGNLTGNASGSAGSVLAAGVTAGAFAAGAYTIPTGGSLAVSGSGTINATSLGGDASALIARLASPTFTTPTLGVASATSINKVALTAPATGSTLTILDGKTLTANHSLTLAGTDSTTMTFPTTSATIARTDAAQSFTGVQTFVAPILGTPTSATLTNATGLPAAGVVGTAAILGTNTFTGVQTFSGSASLGSSYLSTAKVAGTTGTTANLLAKIDSTGNVVDAAVSDVGILGVAVSTATSGNAVQIATRGIINCVADNTTVIGNIAIVGTGTAGRCRDSGQTNSTGVTLGTQVVGKFLSVATVGNSASVQLYGPGHYGAQAATLGANTFTGQQIISLNGAASTPPLKLTGSIFTGGSATSTTPQLLVEPTGTTSTGWSTSGTLAGFNGPSGFVGRLLDLQLNGASKLAVNQLGVIDNPGGTLNTGTITSNYLNSPAAASTVTLQFQSTSTANLFAVNISTGATWSQTSGTNGILKIAPTYNQASGTAANTDLLINRTQTAVGSGAQLLADFQVGGASQWKVTNAGLVTTIGETITGASFILSGLGTATGTPDAVCLNTNTVVRNAALTCTVSSENVKNHLSPIPGTMQDFMAIRPLQFEYNDHPGRTRWGFGAQQVASVNPALADGWRADGQPWSLDQNAILALTVKAVQELTTELARLKAQ